MVPSSGLRTPTRWLVVAMVYCVVAAIAAIGLALQTPWLGLRLVAEPSGVVRVADSRGPGTDVPMGALLLALSRTDGGAYLPLEAQDVMEEPDILDTYTAIDRFFDRQQSLHERVSAPEVRLHWRTDDDPSPRFSDIRPGSRPLTALPAMFWFQLGVAILGCLIATWVWVLRSADWGARMFGITGLMFPLFAMSAAVYSTRELALPGHWFAALSGLNHLSSLVYGAAFAGIFFAYPKRLVPPQVLIGLLLGFGLWWLVSAFRLTDNPDWGFRFPIFTELLLAMGLAVVQWRQSRDRPHDRAALRWLTLSLMTGGGLFIVTHIVTASLGWLPPIPQGYAFGFFLIIYAGVALGLRRYRLFELDLWAYRLLLWIGGALAVLGLDAVLILALDWSAGPALGVSLWVCGALYFPARQWLWARLMHQPRLRPHELLPDLVQIAFSPDRRKREQQWDTLLQRLFDPLELKPLTTPGHTAHDLSEEGLALTLAPCGSLGGRLLRFPDRGRRLFSPLDVRFVSALCKLMDQAEAGREAHERGAQEERRRIARDIHDDVGARLLMLIHSATTPQQAELARVAMTDLRTALSAIDGQPMPMGDAMADWRAEAHQRCEAAHVALEWETDAALETLTLEPRVRSLLERALRECLTNALKHAAPRSIQIRLRLAGGGSIELHVHDDGPSGTGPWTLGRGLRGLEQRLAEQGGTLMLQRPGPDTLAGHTVVLHLPTDPGAKAAQ